MVHNKTLDTALAYEKVDAARIPEKVSEYMDQLLREALPELEEPGAVAPATQALARLRVNTSTVDHLREKQQPIADDARSAGAPWEHLEESAKLARPSSAHSNWGPRRKERTELMRRRQAESRRSGPKEPAPGVSAVQAAKILGIDPRTLKSRAKKGEIRTVTVKSSSGNDRVRYILD